MKIKWPWLLSGLALLITIFVLINSRGTEETNSQMIESVTLEEFQESLILKDSNKIIFIGMDTCPACRDIKPVLMQENKKHQERIVYFDVNLIKNQKEVQKLDIHQVPTFIFFNKGKTYIRDDISVENIADLYDKSSVKKNSLME